MLFIFGTLPITLIILTFSQKCFGSFSTEKIRTLTTTKEIINSLQYQNEFSLLLQKLSTIKSQFSSCKYIFQIRMLRWCFVYCCKKYLQPCFHQENRATIIYMNLLLKKAALKMSFATVDETWKIIQLRNHSRVIMQHKLRLEHFIC